MKAHCILSHGLNSSPHATKVTALAQVADRLGWTHERPDYRDIDAGSNIRDVARRLARLLEQACAVQGPLVLVGSSMGAYISAMASLQVKPIGLFLMAPPIALPGYPKPLDAAVVPTEVIHGWHDELIPAQEVVDWCRPRAVSLHLVDDGHRLENHVTQVADAFERFLVALT